MKSIKKMIALLFAALLVFSLAACGSNTSRDPADTSDEAQETGAGSESGSDSDTSESNSGNETDAPGDPPGDPPEGGSGGTPPDGNGGSGGAPGGASGGNSADIDYTASVEITSADSQSEQTYASTTADESALLISTSDEVTITNPTVTKTGDSDGGDNCNFYGLNAAVLVKDA